MALVEKSNGSITIVDFIAKRQSQFRVASPEIQRSIDYHKQNENIQPQEPGTAVLPIIVVAASADERRESLYYLLGPIFRGEGAVVLKVGLDGKAQSSFQCALRASRA
jgi:hypothetical protein